MSPDLVFSRIQRRPCYRPLYVLEVLYIVRRDCSLSIARAMVCTAAFVMVLVTTMLGTRFSRIEEASSFSTSENSIHPKNGSNSVSYQVQPRVLREITVV